MKLLFHYSITQGDQPQQITDYCRAASSIRYYYMVRVGDMIMNSHVEGDMTTMEVIRIRVAFVICGSNDNFNKSGQMLRKITFGFINFAPPCLHGFRSH